MAYVKRKRVKGHDYFYLVESYRLPADRHGKKGHVRTRTLKYLGTTPEVPQELMCKLGRQRRRAWQRTLWGPAVPAAATVECLKNRQRQQTGTQAS
jgi:hypothetical protein